MKMDNLIRKIKEGENIDQILSFVIDNIYKEGPVSVSDMEILSYLALYQEDKLKEYEDEILQYMGIFYKRDIEIKSLKEVVFGQYKKYIHDTLNDYYTPVQASIVENISNANCFSFSAPTSTGKSFVFMNQIAQCEHDTVIIVPSRALINEYYLKLCNLISDTAVNILTFIDKINTAKARKNIFIVTPERCRELFKQKDAFNVDLFLFDEAQLSNEDSKRGLYFDSIVRRCYNSYPDSKFVFAHPFVANPEAQIKKNHFTTNCVSKCFGQKNVGQMFLCYDSKKHIFWHFGVDNQIMGKIKCDFDPIEKCINEGGSVLFYVSKAKIFDKTFLKKYKKYIDLCVDNKDERVDNYIEKLKEYTGGNTIAGKNHYSQMISLLRKGIVTHHGSLPLQARTVMEEYTRDGFCRICFATSTMEQGINMPFDIVFLDRLEASKPLQVKNIIGRAGRSTPEKKFDYGVVIINNSNTSKFRKIITKDNTLDETSLLEKVDNNDDYKEFKEAILNDTFSDQYNLTQKDLDTLTKDDVDNIIKKILDISFENETLKSFTEIEKMDVYMQFDKLYEIYLGRHIRDGEKNVLHTAIKIMFWKMYCKTFKQICWYRYSYASKAKERKNLEQRGIRTDDIKVNFITGFNDIPNSKLQVFGLFKKGTKAKDVDYDTIVYDTYDYMDKLIGFRLSDIFYASFDLYYKNTNDIRALKMAKYIKFGTDNERHIWMLRYGLTFEDIEKLDDYIEDINESGISFKPSINDLLEDIKAPILRFL